MLNSRLLLLLLAVVAMLSLAGCGFFPPFVPVAPTDLQATVGNGQVSLSWGSSPGAGSYNVKRSTVSGGPYTYIGTVDPAQVQYTDTTVQDGVTYYYVVSAQGYYAPSGGGGILADAVPRGSAPLVPRNGKNKLTRPRKLPTLKRSSRSKQALAMNDLGGGPDPSLESGDSNEVAVTATAHIAPPSPSSIAATGKYQRVELSWASAGTSTDAVTGYNLKRSLTAGGPYATIATLSTGPTYYTDTAVTDGVTYYYVISALSRDLESADSSETSATPVDLPLPAPPSLSTLSAQHYVQLSWTGTITEDQSYIVKRSTTSGGPYDVINTGSGSQSYTDTTVSDGVTYYYVVAAHNPSGDSVDSNEANATPQDYALDFLFDNIGLATGYDPGGASINDATQVASAQLIAGSDMKTGYELYRASLWDPISSYQQNLGLSGPVDYDNPGDSYTTSINNQGQVFGMRQTDEVNGRKFQPFVWDKDNGMQPLTSPGASLPSPSSLGTLGWPEPGSNVVNAANSFGQIVGTSPTATGDPHACLWDGGATDLGTLGGHMSYAEGINDKGDVVGRSETANGDLHAFLWRNGSMIDLNSYLAPYSQWNDLIAASGINNFGEIVGYGDNGGFQRLFVMRHQKAHPSTSCPCEQPTIDRPAPQTISSQWNNGKDWSMKVEVSDNDGLVLRDVQLGHRYMAQEISVPYFTLKTSGFSDAQGNPIRGELKPAGDDTVARSRLIDYQVSPPGSNPLVIKATYGIDRISNTGADSCLSITQRYEFYQETSNNEPSQYAKISWHRDPLKSSPFKPIIEYAYQGGNSGTETLVSINVPQRLHFQDDAKVPNTATFFQDSDTIIGTTVGGLIYLHEPGSVVKNYLAPTAETNFLAILNGNSTGTWDNYHQSYNAEVDSPTTLPPGPGCPECVHIHWRWSALATSPTDPSLYGNGLARVPNGSKQDVEIAVVKYAPGEEHPNDFHDLINNEDLTNQDIVFWYSGTGHQDHDRFFTHGGFFSADGDEQDFADLAVTQEPLSDTVFAVGDTIDFTYHIKNLGGQWAHYPEAFVSLPKGMKLVDATSDDQHSVLFEVEPQTDDGSTLVDCPIGVTLDPGEEMTIHLSVQATEIGQKTDTVNIKSSELFTDSDPTNNSVSQTITVQ